MQSELGPWPRPELPLVAGVSSFGVGGTNCHLVVEEAPQPSVAPAAPAPAPHILTMSCRSEVALRELAQRHEGWLGSESGLSAQAQDVCFTANTGRSAFEHRLCVIGSSGSELRAGLAAFRTQEAQGLGRVVTGRAPSSERRARRGGGFFRLRAAMSEWMASTAGHGVLPPVLSG